jgi:hypothetical protein
MAQETTTIRIGKKDSTKTAVSKLKSGLLSAQTQASHASNVAKSREDAWKTQVYYGGGDMSGDSGGPATSYAKDAARLPIRDAEDMARRNAREAGAYVKHGANGNKVYKNHSVAYQASKEKK